MKKNACTFYHTLNFKLIQVKAYADNRINAVVEHKFVVRRGKTLCSASSVPNKMIAKSFVLKNLIDKFGFTTKVNGSCSIERLNKHAE